MQRRPVSWYWVLLPFNAAIGGFNTFLPLYIISLGGSVVDVGLAATSFNLALIPGSLFWGRFADTTPSRKTPLLSACLGLSLLFVAIYITKIIPLLVLLYAVYAFVSVAFSPTSQLLLMETYPKSEWPRMFARISGISSVGFVLGTLPGIVWTRFFDISSYVLYCLAVAILALALVSRLVPEPPIAFERNAIAQTLDALIERLRQVPLIFLHLPSFSDLARLGKMIRVELTRELPLLYTSMFLFFLSASLFFTSYTPFLKSREIADFDVFLIYFSLFLTNSLFFFGASPVISKLGEINSAQLGFLLRAFCMAVSGFLALTLTGNSLIASSVILLSAIGLTFTLTSTSVTAIVYRRLEAGKQGELLGVYSAMVAAGLLFGSIISGYSSFHLNYTVTFLSAGSVLLLSSLVLRKSQRLS